MWREEELVGAKRRCLMIGAGGLARRWIREFYAPHTDRVEIVGLVDVNEEVLTQQGDYLGLSAHRRFTNMADAFAQVDADFCTIVIPPAFHKDAVLHAVARKMPILSEKPVADTWESCKEIYAAVKGADLKMQVVQNYRYYTPNLTLREVLRKGDLGRINYIVSRFAKDYRVYGSWGAIFRHEIQHSLLIEGAVHHFDAIRNLSGGDPQFLGGWEWNPDWSSSKGQFNTLYTMKMDNGVHATYEGTGTAAGRQNIWHEEYYRVECEHGVAVVDSDLTVRVQQFGGGRGLRVEEIIPVQPQYQEHVAVIDQFLTWLDGGPAPEATIDDNIKSVAMVFAAIEASRTNSTIDVAAMIAEARAEADVAAGALSVAGRGA